ncbi:MAG: aminomethyl-transferring glycine dehydrogenase subunit GcvPA [SAR324 cluster bacterium]|nr:aminomethyl-transferring glycine dehydrogenase subunit GcvPA [SAR324 cluster bacterium]
MKYFPFSKEQQTDMLKTIGVEHISELFSAIPETIKIQGDLKIPEGTTEFTLQREVKAKSSCYPIDHISFLGGGSYRRFIPTAIAPVVNRAEFLTSYTPYQPEASQGTLQAMFEFQTLLANLTGMDAANGSMYEGASAAAEAVMMAARINPKKKNVLLSSAIHPEYLECIQTYLKYQDLTWELIPVLENGQTDLAALESAIDDNSLCSMLQIVNFYGVIEDQKKHGEIVSDKKVLNLALVIEMTSLGLIEAPGAFGADIVVGEGQSLGLPVSFGGPYLGVFAVKAKHIRKMPGRLSGQTVDTEGKRAFCLTLATREQHIRREKATSNICSNQQHCALSVTMYLSLLGKNGLKDLALMNYSKAKEAKEALAQVEGVTLRHITSHYNEFVIDLKKPALEIWEALDKKGILAGVPLVWFDEKDTHGLLVNLTEMNRAEDVTNLTAALKEVL